MEPGAAAHAPAPAGRLKKRSQFLAAAAGRRFHTPRMTVQGIMRPVDADTGQQVLGGQVRIGFTVTKRIGGAPERNRIRRRLRAAVALAGPDWPAASLDLVVIARREAISSSFDALVDDLRRAAPALLTGKNTSPARPRAHGAAGGRASSAPRRRGKGDVKGDVRGDTTGGPISDAPISNAPTSDAPGAAPPHRADASLSVPTQPPACSPPVPGAQTMSDDNER